MIANANEYNLDITRFGRIDTSDGNCRPSGAGEYTPSYNEIAWFNQALGKDLSGEATTEDYVNQGLSGLQLVLSYFSKNRKAAAEQTASETEAKVDNLQKEQNDVKAEVDAQIQEINSQIETNQELITNLIQQLQDTQAEIQEEENKKEELAGKIEDAQKRYAEEQDPQKKEEILKELSGYNEQLVGIVTSLTQKVEASESTTGEIDTTEASIAPLEDQISTVESNGNSRITALGQQIDVQQKQVTATGVLGGVEEGVSTTAGTLATGFEAAASGSSAIPIFGSAASAAEQELARKCRDVESDTKGSSDVYLQLVQQTTPMLAGLVGGNNNISSSITSFCPTALGGVQGINQYVDLAFNVANPIIESIGSIQDTADASEEFAAVIENEEERISSENPEQEGDGDNTSKDDNELINFDTNIFAERLLA